MIAKKLKRKSKEINMKIYFSGSSKINQINRIPQIYQIRIWFDKIEQVKQSFKKKTIKKRIRLGMRF